MCGADECVSLCAFLSSGKDDAFKPSREQWHKDEHLIDSRENPFILAVPWKTPQNQRPCFFCFLIFSANQVPICSEPALFLWISVYRHIFLKTHLFGGLFLHLIRDEVCKMELICWENSLTNPSLSCVHMCAVVWMNLRICAVKWINSNATLPPGRTVGTAKDWRVWNEPNGPKKNQKWDHQDLQIRRMWSTQMKTPPPINKKNWGVFGSKIR